MSFTCDGNTDGDRIFSCTDFKGEEGLWTSFGFGGAVLALITATFLARYVLGQPDGTDKDVTLRKLAQFVHEGAKTFLYQEYIWLTVFVVFMCAALAVIFTIADMEDDGAQGYVVIALIVGAIQSALAGYIGMYIATKANIRTTHACRTGLGKGLSVAFKSGAVMGLGVCGLALLGLSIFTVAYKDLNDPWNYIAGFGFGASSIALFARVGGGVYTKAADVGADLVGKVESALNEDDARNPAVIADNVGDNVGDVAGMGADLFESYAGSIIAACTLCFQAINDTTGDTAKLVFEDRLDMSYSYAAMALPFWIAGAGILASIIGIFAVRTGNDAPRASSDKKLSAEERKKESLEQLERLLWIARRGILTAALVLIVFSGAICGILFAGAGQSFWARVWGCIILGLIAGEGIGWWTEYCTSYSAMPTQSIAIKSDTGPATVVIQGMGVGMISCVVPVIILTVIIVACDNLCGIYGISMAAVGMLSTLGVTLATDAYGPVADNAGGLAEMAHCEEHVRETTDALDALGNTTAATGKGFAIGSAVLTSVGLIAAFMFEVQVSTVDLKKPVVLCGVLIGAMLPYLFGALTMLSVGKAAEMIIFQVRKQFYEENKNIRSGKYKNCSDWDTFDPVTCMDDESQLTYYNECIRISTVSSLQEMLLPGLLAVFSPAIVGFILGAEALAGLLAGGLTSGFMLAVMMSNAGGAWDNAKKYVEKDGLGPGKGKGTDYHKATVVGDTVGDPFKDTSGPALNILIKLMSIVSLVLAPVLRDCCTEEFQDASGYGTGIAALVLMIIVSIIIVVYINSVNKKWYESIDRMAADHKGDSNADVSASPSKGATKADDIEAAESKSIEMATK
eukprot:g295.t1